MNLGELQEHRLENDEVFSEVNVPLSPYRPLANLILARGTPPPVNSYLNQRDLSQRSVSSFSPYLSPVRQSRLQDYTPHENRVGMKPAIRLQPPISPFEIVLKVDAYEADCSEGAPVAVAQPCHPPLNHQSLLAWPSAQLAPCVHALQDTPPVVAIAAPRVKDESTYSDKGHSEVKSTILPLPGKGETCGKSQGMIAIPQPRKRPLGKRIGMKKPYPCQHCKMSFMKAQGLGGHMSRKHPGESEKYSYKTRVRDQRTPDRVKLLLAKKKYFRTLNYDYEDLIQTAEGKLRARAMMNRSQVKRLKNGIADGEVRSYLSDQYPDA